MPVVAVQLTVPVLSAFSSCDLQYESVATKLFPRSKSTVWPSKVIFTDPDKLEPSLAK